MTRIGIVSSFLRPALLAPLLLLLFLLRDPRVLLHAQFWAEDGWLFFAQAWNQNFPASLVSPSAGYQELSARLCASLALLFPLEWSPTVIAFAALLLQFVPVLYLLSRRLAPALPTPALRAATAALLVLLPNSAEVYVTAIGTKWYLALAALCVLWAEPPRSRRAWTADVAVLSLSALSGPFVLVLLPLALTARLLRRHTGLTLSPLAYTVILAAGALAQAPSILFTGQTRVPQPGLVPSWGQMIDIVGLNWVWQTLLGYYLALRLHASGSQALMVAAILGLVVVAAALWRDGRFFHLSALALAAVTVYSATRWPVFDATTLASGYYGSRYFLFGAFFLAAAAPVLIHRGGPSRFVGLLIAAPLLLIAVPRDYRHFGFLPDTHFPDQVSVFRTLPVGLSYYFPVNPENIDHPGLFLRARDQPRAAHFLRDLPAAPGTPFVKLAPLRLEAAPPEQGGCVLEIAGVVLAPSDTTTAGGVVVNVDGRLFPAVTGLPPGELLDRGGIPDYRSSGFKRRVPCALLPPAATRWSLIVLNHERSAAYAPVDEGVLELAKLPLE